MKKFLKLDSAIALANVDRIKEGKFLIKNKKHLSRVLASDLKSNSDNIYMQLYRAEKEGFITENEDLINQICSELNTDRNEIILSSI